MTILIALTITFVNLFWLLLAAAGLPGTWMIALTTLGVACWTWPDAGQSGVPMFGVAVLAVIFGLALLGELLEFFAGVAGARKAGGSAWGSVGALIGSIIGGISATFMIPIPIVGSLLGACIGAAAGAWLFEFSAGRTHDDAVKSGVGAGVGRFKGTIAKLMVGGLMWMIASIAAFWP